mmetsp:Transcript_7212/g.11491  ORF Transcript_7212/g.11491 Transcript_7212/m.11491 type:complete len:82 (+) Transcript_7212:349-594(+)
MSRVDQASLTYLRAAVPLRVAVPLGAAEPLRAAVPLSAAVPVRAAVPVPDALFSTWFKKSSESDRILFPSLHTLYCKYHKK